METNHHHPDEAIDRTLAALRDAAPPEAMAARILARVAEHPPAQLSTWARLTSSLQVEGAWLRGALAGALIATAACAILFITLRHSNFVRVESATTAARVPRPSRSISHDGWDERHASPTTTTPVALNTGAPCAGQMPHSGSAWRASATASAQVPHSSRGVMRDVWEEKPSRAPHFLPASFAPSHPVPPVPLTTQERALIELARNATPAELASLRPKQKSDAERQAAFDSFFAPSPEIQAVDDAQKEALGITDDESVPLNSPKESQP